MSTGEPLDSLEGRIRRLERYEQVARRLNMSVQTFDRGLLAEWLDCFTTDATLDVRDAADPLRIRQAKGARHDLGVRHTGTEQLTAFFVGHERDPATPFAHLLVAPVVTLLDDEAMATSYLLRVDVIGKAVTPVALSRYTDEVRLCGDGEWRLSNRVIDVQS